MNRLLLLFTTLVCWASLSCAAPAPAPVRAEIETLLNKLQSSGCQFNRNGSWYSGAEAKDHLLKKLAYFEDKAEVKSTEQFIDLAATKSSMSGKAYQVKCDGEQPVDSQRWLTVQLTALRSAASKPKP
ncbi:DUF5329 domain-containing protein [Burkholderiaceae bacterium UC74_6]